MKMPTRSEELEEAGGLLKSSSTALPFLVDLSPIGRKEFT